MMINEIWMNKNQKKENKRHNSSVSDNLKSYTARSSTNLLNMRCTDRFIMKCSATARENLKDSIVVRYK